MVVSEFFRTFATNQYKQSIMGENYEKYQELLEKWKNFSKVYDAIRMAYELGYEEGIEAEKYHQVMVKAETLDPNCMPSAD